jgi:uncharacterized protein (DUF983 family)
MNDTAGPGTVHMALSGLCPRCGKGPLFAGYLTLAPKCSACDLDYSVFDPGDGPAVFVILIVGAIVAAGALYVEFTFHPPYWVHAVIWLPAITILTFALLRLAKSTLVVLQYKHQAQEGRRIK